MRSCLAMITVAGLFGVNAAQAAPIAFDSSAEYDASFREVYQPANVGWNASGYVQNATGSSVYSGVVYDTTPADGTATRDIVDTGEITVDFLLPGNNSTLALYFRLNEAETDGYAIYVANSSTADYLRFWRTGNIQAEGSGSGAAVATVDYASNATNWMASNVWHTLVLRMTDTASEFGYQVEASVFVRGETVPLASITWEGQDASSLLDPGAVGFRLRHGAAFDNLNIVVPEPASLGLIGATCLLACRCRAGR